MLRKFILIFYALAFTDCQNKSTINLAQAEALLKKTIHFPLIIEEKIDLEDWSTARKMRKMGLDKNGYVLLNTHFFYRGKRILFTPKAQPFLGKHYLKRDIWGETRIQVIQQGVKNLDKIVAIKFARNANRATIMYKIKYSNLNPFSNLNSSISGSDDDIHMISFEFVNGKWINIQYPGEEFMGW